MKKAILFYLNCWNWKRKTTYWKVNRYSQNISYPLHTSLNIWYLQNTFVDNVPSCLLICMLWTVQNKIHQMNQFACNKLTKIFDLLDFNDTTMHVSELAELWLHFTLIWLFWIKVEWIRIILFYFEPKMCMPSNKPISNRLWTKLNHDEPRWPMMNRDELFRFVMNHYEQVMNRN